MAKKPDLDAIALLRHLRDGGVEFVVIGGLAVIAHGGSTVTEDVDICAPISHETATRIIQALQDVRPIFRMRPDLGPVFPDNRNLRLLKNIYLWTDAGQLDVLGEVPNVCSYDELAKRCVSMTFDDVECRVIDLDTLLAAKRAANRDKDQLAIKQLELIKRQRDQNPGLFDRSD